MAKTVEIQLQGRVPEELQVPDAALRVPVASTPASLRELVAHLLSRDPAELPALQFVCESTLIRSTLEAALDASAGERVVTVEYFEALLQPSESQSYPHDDWISAISTDHHTAILFASFDGTVQAMHGAEKVLLDSRQVPVKALSTCILDDSTIMAAYGGKDRKVYLTSYDVSQRAASAIAESAAGGASIEDVCFDATGKHIATASTDGIVSVWPTRPVPASASGDAEPSTAKRRRASSKTEAAVMSIIPRFTLRAHTQSATGIRFVGEAKLVSGGHDGCVKVVDIESTSEERSLSCGKAINALDISDVSGLVVTAHADKFVRLWDPRIDAGRAVEATLGPHKNWTTDVAFHPSNEHRFCSASLDGRVRVWDTRATSTPVLSIKGHEDKVFAARWWRDGASIVSGGADSTLRVASLADAGKYMRVGYQSAPGVHLLARGLCQRGCAKMTSPREPPLATEDSFDDQASDGVGSLTRSTSRTLPRSDSLGADILGRVCTDDANERAAAAEDFFDELAEEVRGSKGKALKAVKGVLRLLLHRCPLPEVRERALSFVKQYAGLCREQDIAIDLPLEVSRFFPISSLYPENEADGDRLARESLMQDLFLASGPSSNIQVLLSVFPAFLERYSSAYLELVRGRGPLPLEWRWFIGAMAAAACQCQEVVSMCEREFRLCGGDEGWLRSPSASPEKLRALCAINGILMENPWKLTWQSLHALSNDPESPWSAGELVHAVALLTTFHFISSLSLSCGVLGDEDDCDTLASAGLSEDGSFDEPHVDLASKLREQRPLADASQQDLFTGADDARTGEGLSECASHGDDMIALARIYGVDLDATYEDFDPIKHKCEPFNVHNFSWNDNGIPLLEQFYPELGQLLDDEFQMIQTMTDNSVAGAESDTVDTRPFRMAIWTYVYRVMGMFQDDLDYGEVNRLLTIECKRYIKKAARRPHTIIRRDFVRMSYGQWVDCGSCDEKEIFALASDRWNSVTAYLQYRRIVMGFLSALVSKVLGRKKASVLCVGLDNSGKSTIVNHMKPKSATSADIAPTVGFKVEKYTFQNVQFTVFDMSGQGRYRTLWEHYFHDTQAIIFVIDTSDRFRAVVAKDELQQLLQRSELNGIPILFFANKQDKKGSMTAVECTVELGLDSIRDRRWHIQPSNALSGDGLAEGMAWLVNHIR